ncbi:MAG: hypothetical protein PHD40_07700 [Syntrophomonadaceae bacterium]|nr:hypothetical protein [Syntrophomonadaceae bacterium]
MEMIRIDNFRLTDRNKANGNVIFNYEGDEAWADFNFYLQSTYCVSIRLGRHDTRLETRDIEEFIRQNSQALKQQVQPDVERLRRERREGIMAQQD